MWNKIKPNALWFGTLAFAAACVSAYVLVRFAGGNDAPPVEILIILATAFGGSIMLLGNLSGQAMQDAPPNHVANVLSTVENMASKVLDKFK